ncbi:MAG: phosphate acyltransferase PlsX [Pseudomonadota bacterium]
MTDLPAIALDAMGGDSGVETILDGAAMALAAGVAARFIFSGDEQKLQPLLAARSDLATVSSIRHAEGVVAMADKPSQAMRRRDTSLWGAVAAVKAGDAKAAVSCGNTGALMAVSKLQLRMIAGVARPAIAALWPTPRGRCVVLDVGANVEADADQLVQFAIMGEAFFRALTGEAQPSVGLLNVGAEELKGHELIRTAGQMLRAADPDMNFKGFVEGDDISAGAVDVIATDGFSGNIALKSAEGAARLVSVFLKEALTSSLWSKIGALVARGALLRLKDRMDPSSVNGGVFLGLNGIIVKSHGGSDAKGVSSAIAMAADLARSPFNEEIAATVARVEARLEDRPGLRAQNCEAAAS